MQIYAAEVMCGIGGATRGFLDADVQVIRGVDIDESCQKTYQENNKPAKFLKKDIQYLSSEELLAGIDLKENDKFILIACAPCQPFSRAGAKKPKDSKTIISAISRLIHDIRPDFVFAENAPGIQKIYPDIYEEFLKPYDELKYKYRCGVINLKDYGVPQNRLRYLFIASRDYEIDLPTKTHGEGLLHYVTVKDTIKKYPLLRPGKENKAFHNHVCYNISEITLERLRYTPKDGGSRSAWPSNLVLKCHQGNTGHSDVYGRMRWDSVGPTLTCRCINVSNGRFAHPTQNRGISVREAAALQTFRDNFILYEPKSIAAKHIGNAVPPIVASLFAKKILEIISKNVMSTPYLSANPKEAVIETAVK